MRHPGTPAEWLLQLTAANPEVRHNATLIIGGLTDEHNVPIDGFLEALRSDNESLVFWSIVGLGRLGKRSVPAVSALVEISRAHTAFGIRQAAIAALRDIAPSDAQTKAAIFAALDDDSPFVRREALQSTIAVSSLSNEDLARIEEMSTDSDETVSRWSEVVLRNIRAGGQHE